MSDDEADPELLALLRQHLQGKPPINNDPETGVLESAEYVYNNSIDVALDMRASKAAATAIYSQMQQKAYSPATWSEHDLHPKAEGGPDTVAFIFTMDLLNFCFWSELSEEKRFAIEYRGKRWTGYWSLVAALQRALDEVYLKFRRLIIFIFYIKGIPITDPHFWQNEDEFTLNVLRNVFRSCTDEEIPLLKERLDCLREAGNVLYDKYKCHPVNLIAAADGSAARLVNLLARDFSCFRDEHGFDGRKKPIRLLKRAQILVADLWACFEGEDFGDFWDIDKITMFADYRVPQMLNSMGCLLYSPPLDSAIRSKKNIPSGSNWELQLRACSIWCVELIRREILTEHPEAEINAILIDFFLYDTIKEMELNGQDKILHHRTRSIWY
ncbi:hypothetical protein QBC35DRAFT_472284 [Podospora australis]|uniref:Queuosine 5'-phosphate N-glycosylase/hydrolase n=1 Tax=Podospora australis TaxID=1536484 RepID=A0AAN7AJT7_9PEZI|nr:hypothetical protein QBC35DRAFT_472284 [Podospora australis]